MEKKNALILAAGLGTRMRPLTNDRPKALVEFCGHTLLEITIRRLLKYGFRNIVVNVHYYADMVEEYLRENRGFGADIHISDERSELLDTGGGILKASEFFRGEPFLVHNADILTNMDLEAFFNDHLESDALATLAVKERPTSRSLLVNSRQQLCGWKNNITGEVRISREKIETLHPIAFSAIHAVKPELIEKITERGVFSIIDVYLRLAASESIITSRHDRDIWADLGTPEHLAQAEKQFGNLID